MRALTFSPEDAIVVAYGSFGIDLSMPSLGVETIVTNDLRLASHFRTRYVEIEHRFNEMIAQLSGPYTLVALPEVVTTASILAGL